MVSVWVLFGLLVVVGNYVFADGKSFVQENRVLNFAGDAGPFDHWDEEARFLDDVIVLRPTAMAGFPMDLDEKLFGWFDRRAEAFGNFVYVAIAAAIIALGFAGKEFFAGLKTMYESAYSLDGAVVHDQENSAEANG